MTDLLSLVMDFVDSTHLVEQIRQVDVKGLFTNPWFLVPFIAQVGWWLYKQALNSLVCAALVIGVWWFSGSHYAQGLVVNGQLQLSKVLPVGGVGIVVIAVLVYLFFIRSD